MPIVEHIHQNNEYEIVVWKLSESKEELLEKVVLSPTQIKKYSELSDKRQKEFLGIQNGLQYLNLKPELHYDEKGKPYIEDNVYISLSHSYAMVAIATSKFPIGVDIELKRDEKIKNIKEKFIRPDEEIFIPKDATEFDYLHIIWGFKEGLYKLNGGNLWNFLHHYRVEPFSLNTDQKIYGWLSDGSFTNKYAAYYTMIEDYYLVWVIDILD